jgi:thioredoxin-dependent peroxiredoxin
MKSNKKALAMSVLLGLAVLALTLGAAVIYAADPPAVGVMAPDFKLTSQEGTSLGPKDFRGKWVVLYFYPKDFTQGCTIEAHGFQRDIKQYEAKNAVIVGVSVDSTDSHKDFCAKEGLDFKLLSDAEHKVSTQYGSLSDGGVALRNTFIVNPQGKIAKVFLKVQPTPHSEEVLAALAELQKK